MENNYLLKHHHQQPSKQQQQFYSNNRFVDQWSTGSSAATGNMLIQGRGSPATIIDYGTARGTNSASYYASTSQPTNSLHLITRSKKNLPTHPWPTAIVSAGDPTTTQSSQHFRTMPRNNAIPTRLIRDRSAELLGTQSEPDLRPVASVSAATAVAAADEENTRWFVALFDYSPHMSPNPNAQQDELFFRKHQLIKVFF